MKEPTRYQLLSDARSWDAGPRVERHVARDDKVRATSHALARVYARCLPRTRCPRSHRGHWDRPARPKLDLRPAAPSPGRTAGRCEPGTTMAVHSWWRGPRGSGAVALRLPRPRRGLLQERARSPGQPARPGGSARTRRGGPTPTCSAGREPWPRTRPHPDHAPAGPTGGEYGGTAMRLRPGRARRLGGLVGAWLPGQGR